jgi:hypothetical protein
MQPKDNDGSGDLFDDIPAPSAKAMDKLFRVRRRDAHERWERLGALQMFIEGLPAALSYLSSATIHQAEEDAEILLADEEWLAEWKYGGRNNTPAVRANLTKFANVIRDIRSKR